VSRSSLSNGPVHRSWRSDEPSTVLGKLPISLAWVELEVEVNLDIQDGIWAHGSLRAAGEAQCRRCLISNEIELETQFNACFRLKSEVGPGAEGVWVYDPMTPYVDLSEALWEEIWLKASGYVECSPKCLGLCSGCGVLLDSEACTCLPPGDDPRWAPLRKVKG
jgi:uncharacterized protein